MRFIRTIYQPNRALAFRHPQVTRQLPVRPAGILGGISHRQFDRKTYVRTLINPSISDIAVFRSQILGANCLSSIPGRRMSSPASRFAPLKVDKHLLICKASGAEQGSIPCLRELREGLEHFPPSYGSLVCYCQCANVAEGIICELNGRSPTSTASPVDIAIDSASLAFCEHAEDPFRVQVFRRKISDPAGISKVPLKLAALDIQEQRLGAVLSA